MQDNGSGIAPSDYEGVGKSDYDSLEVLLKERHVNFSVVFDVLQLSSTIPRSSRPLTICRP